MIITIQIIQMTVKYTSFELHKCSVFSNSSITRNRPTVDLVKNPDLVKFELLTKNFTKSGVYCIEVINILKKIKD